MEFIYIIEVCQTIAGFKIRENVIYSSFYVSLEEAENKIKEYQKAEVVNELKSHYIIRRFARGVVDIIEL